jgi:UDP-N-acetylglucosamine--N-acetylmuramyl-(pentapeptide) pyrophosphoryl-undecaprenol N-acetylglucosamine transferase
MPLAAKAILVFGGSQGSVRLNAGISDCLNNDSLAQFAVIHIVGQKNEFQHPASSSYFPLNYLDRMDLAYSAVDFVIARAGAMTVAEVTAAGLPACFIPLPIGNGEQSLNAQPVVAAGGAVLISDLEFTADFVEKQILPILRDDSALAAMATASASLGHKNAAAALADLVLSVVRNT